MGCALIFLVILTGVLATTNSVIILNSGNPARFIRGTFMDANQPELKETVITKQEQQLSLREDPGFASIMTESIMNELVSFNQAMTAAIISEVQEISGKSAVQICRFSRTRMTALGIINSLQASSVQLATTQNLNGPTEDEVLGTLVPAMPDLSAGFALMEEDLHNFDEGKHGKLPMVHFARAVTYFTHLNMAIIQSLKEL